MKTNEEKTYVSLLCNHDGCPNSFTRAWVGGVSEDLKPEGKLLRAEAESHDWDTVNDLCPEHKK